MEVIALLSVTVFFAIYGLACSVECGIALSMLNPPSKVRRYYLPLWEITNVFLIFGFIGLSVMFSHALSALSSALLSTLALGLVALLTRSVLGLSVFYVDSKRWQRTLAWLFLIVSFAVPLIFAAAAAYLFTGQLFWQSLTGITLMAATFLGVTSLGLVSMDHPRRASSLISNEMIYATWLLVLGTALPLSTYVAMPHIKKLPLLTLSFLCILGLLMVLIALTAKPKIRLWQTAAIISFASPLLLALANQPFLVAGKITLAEAFSGQAYLTTFVIGTFVMLPLIALGFWLFWRLLRAPSDSDQAK